MTAQQIIATRSLRAEFGTCEGATRFIDNCISPSKWTVVLGDLGRYWVVSNRDASVLVASGYEYAL